MKTFIIPLFWMFVSIIEVQSANDDRSARAVNIAAIRPQLESILGTSSIPDKIAKVVGALESALDILKCLPLQRIGNCYRPSDYCEINTNDITMQARLTICKYPWKLILDFKLPKDFKKKIPGLIRPFVYIDVNPIVLTFDQNKTDGITKLVSNRRIAKAGLSLFGIKVGAAKAYFNFDLIVRWDCTRPTNNNLKRLQYNQAYDDGKPGNDMNKLYYKLKIGYEIKVKEFPCFCYKCKKCETIIDKEGHFAEGPESCKSDWSAWRPPTCTYFMQCEGIPRQRTCIGQSTGGPPCPGASTSPCGGRPFDRWKRERRMMCP